MWDFYEKRTLSYALVLSRVAPSSLTNSTLTHSTVFQKVGVIIASDVYDRIVRRNSLGRTQETKKACKVFQIHSWPKTKLEARKLHNVVSLIQGYLSHKKLPRPKNLRWDFA